MEKYRSWVLVLVTLIQMWGSDLAEAVVRPASCVSAALCLCCGGSNDAQECTVTVCDGTRAGPMGEAAMRRMAASLRIEETGGRHIFICADQTVPKCCPKVSTQRLARAAEGQQAWRRRGKGPCSPFPIDSKQPGTSTHVSDIS